jgi:hypothetical protein
MMDKIKDSHNMIKVSIMNIEMAAQNLNNDNQNDILAEKRRTKEQVKGIHENCQKSITKALPVFSSEYHDAAKKQGLSSNPQAKNLWMRKYLEKLYNAKLAEYNTDVEKFHVKTAFLSVYGSEQYNAFFNEDLFD